MRTIHRVLWPAPLLGVAAFLATSCAPQSSPVEESAPISQAMPNAQTVAATTAEAAGQTAPDFTLTDTNGKTHKLSDFRGKYVVLEWLNHGCPFVQKQYGSGNMQRLQKQETEDGVVWLSIVSSAPGKQGNYSGAQHNKMAKEAKAAPTAILLDADGKVGKLNGSMRLPVGSSRRQALRASF